MPFLKNKIEWMEISMLANETKTVKQRILLSESRVSDQLLSVFNKEEGINGSKIEYLEQELHHKTVLVDEMISFFSTWTKAFDSIIQTPVNLENEEHIRIHYGSMRNSARNLVTSCRKKIEEFEGENK